MKCRSMANTLVVRWTAGKGEVMDDDNLSPRRATVTSLACAAQRGDC